MIPRIMAKNKPKEDSTKKTEETPGESSKSEASPLNIQVRKKELIWISGVMVFLILVLFLTSYLAKSTNTFTFQTLKFEKQLYGTIPVYVYAYTFKDITGSAVQEYNYQLLLRLDPRKNDVLVNGNIDLSLLGRDVYISVNTTGFNFCPTTSRDFASLSGFLTTNLFNITTGVPDAQTAAELNRTQVTCDLYPQNTVLMIQTSNITDIQKVNNSCYLLNVANCETLNVVEKFEVQSLLDAKNKKRA